MAYYKPQSPIKNGENYIYPLTTYDQVIMPDGTRWNGEALDNTTLESAKAYIDAEIVEWIGDTTVSSQISTAVGQMSQQISQKASTANYLATLSSSGWSSSAPYSQTVSVSGILSTDVPFVDVDMSVATTADEGAALTEAWGLIGRVTADTDSITAYCYEEKPTVDVSLILKVVR